MQIILYSENERAVNPNNKNIKQEKKQNKSKKWIVIIILLLLLFIIILVVLIYLFVLRKKQDNNVEENILNNNTNTTNTTITPITTIATTITEEQCEIGADEKCKTCNSNLGLKEQCWDCNDGYYLPTDGNKKKCQSLALFKIVLNVQEQKMTFNAQNVRKGLILFIIIV